MMFIFIFFFLHFKNSIHRIVCARAHACVCVGHTCAPHVQSSTDNWTGVGSVSYHTDPRNPASIVRLGGRRLSCVSRLPSLILFCGRRGNWFSLSLSFNFIRLFYIFTFQKLPLYMVPPRWVPQLISHPFCFSERAPHSPHFTPASILLSLGIKFLQD